MFPSNYLDELPECTASSAGRCGYVFFSAEVLLNVPAALVELRAQRIADEEKARELAEQAAKKEAERAKKAEEIAKLRKIENYICAQSFIAQEELMQFKDDYASAGYKRVSRLPMKPCCRNADPFQAAKNQVVQVLIERDEDGNVIGKALASLISSYFR